MSGQTRHMRRWLLAVGFSVLLVGCSSGNENGPATVGPPFVPPATTVAPSATASSTASTAPSAAAPSTTGTPSAQLRVAGDGCGVIRTEVVGARSLTWSIRDAEGFEVLARNAEREDRYRYFRPGRYTVVLTAFLDGSYVPISNTADIACG